MIGLLLFRWCSCRQFPDTWSFARAKSSCPARLCYAGPLEKGAAEIQSGELDWSEPATNQFRPVSFKDADKISDKPPEPFPSSAQSLILKKLADEVISVLLSQAFPENNLTPLLFVETRHASGTISRADQSAVAFVEHEAPFILTMIGLTPNSDFPFGFH